MTLRYRYDGAVNTYTWTGLGRKLTALEVDENFGTIKDEINQLSDAIDDGFGIDDISVNDEINPSFFTITLTDAREFTIPLPLAAPDYKGAWTHGATYYRLDIVDVSGIGQYILNIPGPYTAPGSGDFDPDETSGGDLVWKLWNGFTSRLRWRGEFTATDYLVYDIFVDDTYGAFVVLQDHIATSPLDQFAESGGNPLYFKLAGPHFSPPDTVATTTYEISLDDIGKYLRCTHGSGCAVSFPDLEFPVGTEIHFRQAGSGAISFVEAGTDVVLNPQRVGYDTSTPWVGATVTAKYLGGAEWDLIGPHGDELSA